MLWWVRGLLSTPVPATSVKVNSLRVHCAAQNTAWIAPYLHREWAGRPQDWESEPANCAEWRVWLNSACQSSCGAETHVQLLGTISDCKQVLVVVRPCVFFSFSEMSPLQPRKILISNSSTPCLGTGLCWGVPSTARIRRWQLLSDQVFVSISPRIEHQVTAAQGWSTLCSGLSTSTGTGTGTGVDTVSCHNEAQIEYESLRKCSCFVKTCFLIERTLVLSAYGFGVVINYKWTRTDVFCQSRMHLAAWCARFSVFVFGVGRCFIISSFT